MSARLISAMALSLAMLLFFGCGSSAQTDSARKDEVPRDQLGLYQPVKAADSDEPGLSQEEGSGIGRENFTGIEASLPAVKAFSPLEVQLNRAPDSAWALHYDWIVNDEHIKEIDAPVLPGSYTHPQVWIRCHVRIQPPDGDEIFATLRSNMIKVSPLPPILIPAVIEEELSLPGRLRLTLLARDPNEPEGSENKTLSFFLEGHEEENIIIDQHSGQLSWVMDQESLNRLGEELTIRYRVESSWGSSISSSLTIPIRKEALTPEEEQ